MSLAIGYNPQVGRRRRLVCYFWHNGWDHISLGLHVSLTMPNLEIHLPFGFLRIGWHRVEAGYMDGRKLTWAEADRLLAGFNERSEP